MKLSICVLLIILGAYSAQAQKPQYEIDVRRGDTSMGKITVEMFPAIAPNHVRNWDSLVAINFYDALAFHRVIADFMIQGGDPNSRDGDPSTWGYGDPEQQTIDAEFSAVSHRRGILSAARTPDPNSATSQFFICVGNPTHLDRDYTVYGRAISGMDVVDLIVMSETDGTMPVDKISMFITKTGMNDEVTAVPEHAMPLNDTGFSATSQVMFRWHPVSGAMMYRLQVANDDAFTEITHDTTISQMDTNIRLRNFESFQKYYWRMMANNGGSPSTFSTPWSFYNGLLSVENELTNRISLEGISPSPVSERGTVHFTLTEGETVTLSIVDILGRTVQTLLMEVYVPGGSNKIDFDAGKLTSGFYMLTLEVNGLTFTKQLIVE